MATRLAQILAAVPGLQSVETGTPVDAEHVVIGRVALDARRTEPGDLIAIRTDDPAELARRVEQSARGAAAAVLVPAAAAGAAVAAIPGDAPALAVIAAEDPSAAAAIIAEKLAGHPSRSLDLVAVTGTNGKTTVSWLLHQVLLAAEPAGLAGTVVQHDGRRSAPAALTTPDAPALSALLARMVAHGCRVAACEASSHGLAQGRLDGVRIAAAVFTNLSGDHLDYHGSETAYRAAKQRLFERLHPEGTAIVNADDSRGSDMIAASAGRDVLRVSAHDASAEVRVEVLAGDATGSDLRVHGPWGTVETRVPVSGDFNAMNAAQVLAAVWAVGRDVTAAAAALPAATPPPGRLQPVTLDTAPAGGMPAVSVDYAHTDDALDRMLAAMRRLVPAGKRLHVVFGCGGDRDRTKRPRMAAAAARHADVVMITSDNPRTEDPERIIDDAWAGLPEAARPTAGREADRAAAIHAAVSAASPGDLVIIAGKGHEADQDLGGGRRIPFDDVAVARAALTARLVSASTSTSPSPASSCSPAPTATTPPHSVPIGRDS